MTAVADDVDVSSSSPAVSTTAAHTGWFADTDPSTRFPVHTRLNASDVLPDPVTPLGADLIWRQNVLTGWAFGYADLGMFTAEEMTTGAPPSGAILYGHLYVNMSAVRIIGIRMGLGWRALDAAFFAGDVPPPEHEDRPSDVNEAISASIAARGAWTMTTTEFPELEEERELADQLRATRPDLDRLTPAMLVARARSIAAYERLTWRSEVIGSNQAAVGPAVLAQVLGDQAGALSLRIIGPSGDVDSAAPSFALWELSRLVRSRADLTAAFDAGVDGVLERTAGHDGFSTGFARFLREFGYRGPGEWDLGSDAWETRPELVLGLLERMRLIDDDQDPRAKNAAKVADAEVALAQALALLAGNEEAIGTLHAAVASARRFANWRERAKANCIKVIHEARMALLALGRRLHEQGHLTRPEQIFMALDDELDRLCLEPATLSATLQGREEQWRRLFGLKLPTFLDVRQPLAPLSSLPRLDEVAVAAVAVGDVLQGAPASAGVSRGIARIVTDVSKADRLDPGDILVAPQTDPSWTPLFVVSAGVIVDVGAMGSHAMIVSRELGIPCVAGTPNASRRIPDGALVEIDGSAGTVTILGLP